MATTPEGKVKNLVKDLLAEYGLMPAAKAGTFDKADGWYFFAVQGPMSVKGIPDVIGHYYNNFFGVEVKAPKKQPSGFQALQISAIRRSGGAVFVIDGPESLKVFEEWLQSVRGCKR